MATTSATHRSAKSIIRDVLKVIVPLTISAGLVIWLFHKVDYHKVEAIVRQGVDYRYIFAMMVVTVLSHIIRGIRWGIQLRAVGVPRMTPVAESVSIFGAYALNLVFPYLGEAWRCIFVSHRENFKLSTIVGTDLGDRASDGIMISLITLLAVWVAHPAMLRFLDHYKVGKTIEHTLTDGYMILWIAGVIAVLAVTVYLLRHTRFITSAKASCLRIWNGFAVLFHLNDIWLYLLLTIGIWTCYFSETYLCLYAFPFTRELIHTPGTAWGLIPGLVVFVFGSCSMIVPSNGGLGPWNLAVMFALSLYGISTAEGAAYAMLCWSFQAITLIALGIFSAFYISHTSRKSKAVSPAASESCDSQGH